MIAESAYGGAELRVAIVPLGGLIRCDVEALTRLLSQVGVGSPLMRL
jgi:hypothetical protein